MKISDMILVIENIKGTEKNMLMTAEDYQQEYLFVASLSREEAAAGVKELYDTKVSKTGWAEQYITANKSFHAKFCNGSQELQCFLLGSYNDSREFRFDTERSSKECIQALEEYNLDINGGAKGNMFHYEKMEHDFRQGEILHNFNGTDYRVVECYSKNNLLVMNMASGQFVVALDVAYFSRYPYAGEHTNKNAETGIEWGRGIYLSATPSEIDFVSLRTEYCEPYELKGDEFSIEIREVLSRIEKIPADNLGEAIDRAMDMYKTEQVVLDADHFVDVSYIPVKEESR